MSNHHKYIAGDRPLSAAEVQLMHKVKELGPIIRAVMDEVMAHTARQYEEVGAIRDMEERMVALHRLNNHSRPSYWIEQSRHEFQSAIMKLVRAVAQPNDAL